MNVKIVQNVLVDKVAWPYTAELTLEEIQLNSALKVLDRQGLWLVILGSMQDPCRRSMQDPCRSLRIHAVEKPYKCEDGSKSYSIPQHLVRHQKTPTGFRDMTWQSWIFMFRFGVVQENGILDVNSALNDFSCHCIVCESLSVVYCWNDIWDTQYLLVE